MSAPTPPNPRDDALIEAGMILASELSLDAVLQRIVELAVEITDARYGALGVLTPDGRAIEEFITVGVTPRSAPRSATLPSATACWACSSRRWGRSASPTSAPTRGRCGFPPNHPPMGSFLGRSRRRARQGVRQHLPHGEAGRRRVHPGRRGRAHRPRDPGRCRRRERAPVRGDAAAASRAGAACPCWMTASGSRRSCTTG